MHAEFVEDADPPLRVAEGDEILAEQGDPQRVAIRLRELFRYGDWVPVPPHDLAHLRVWPNPAKRLVLLVGEHGVSLTSIIVFRGRYTNPAFSQAG